MSLSVKIPPLDEGNYHFWKKQMRAYYLVQNNLGDAILVDKDEWTEEQVAANMD